MPTTKSLEDRISEATRKASLDQIREAVRALWGEQRVIRDFTKHDLEHCLRVKAFVERMLEKDCFSGRKLTSDEAYVLCAAVYLHDIGNQCTDLEVLAEFGIGLSPDVPSTNLPQEIQDAIRKSHHLISAQWIKQLYLRRSSPPESTQLEQAIKSIPERLVRPIMDVSKYHSQLSIVQCREEFEIVHRRRFLALLLRLADEMDIGSERVDIDTVIQFHLAPHNAVWWWLHYMTQCIIGKTGQLTFQIRVHEEDRPEIQTSLKTLVVDRFNDKNQRLIEMLWPMGVRLQLKTDDDNLIQSDEFPRRLPDEIIEEIKGKSRISRRAGEAEKILTPQDKLQKLVLVVEDDPGMLAWLADHIPMETPLYALSPVKARSIQEARQRVRQQVPDLILTDIYLIDEEWNDRQTCFDLLRSLPSSLPIVIVSGSYFSPLELAEFRGQIRDFIRKTELSPERLTTAIMTALGPVP